MNSIDVEISYHFSSIGPTPTVKVFSTEEEPLLLGHFAYGIPIYTFNVPTETGRKYRLYIEELPSSRPKAVENPWRKGQFA